MAEVIDLRTITVNADSDGDNLIISLPGQKKDERVVIVGYMLSLSAAGTITIRTTDDVLIFELKDPGASYAGTPDAPAIFCPFGKNIEINVPAGVDANGHLSFYID